MQCVSARVARSEQLGRVRGHGATALDFLLVERAGVRRRRIVSHLLERPDEVDGGRTRSGERCSRFVEVLPTCRGERERVRRGNADRRSAANRQLANRDDDLCHRAALQLDLFVRQAALVEEDDLRAVLLVPNDVFWV